MAWPLVIGGLAAAGIGAYASARGQKAANESNERIARENRMFQERMSSTAWQRGVQDMRAAGLNPMLAYSQGPASTTQGSVARMENVLRDMPHAAGQLASAMELMKFQKEMRLLDAEASLRIDQGFKANSEANMAQVLLQALSVKDASGRSMA